MLNVKENTDIHTFAKQLEEHLGPDFWVLVENKPPAAKAHFNAFEENNFPLPKDLELFYRDTNGTSLTWGDNEQLHSSLGHFQIVHLELIRSGLKIFSRVRGPYRDRDLPGLGLTRDIPGLTWTILSLKKRTWRRFI